MTKNAREMVLKHKIYFDLDLVSVQFVLLYKILRDKEISYINREINLSQKIEILPYQL
jgi:hypothetical protein